LGISRLNQGIPYDKSIKHHLKMRNEFQKARRANDGSLYERHRYQLRRAAESLESYGTRSKKENVTRKKEGVMVTPAKLLYLLMELRRFAHLAW
jgi:hypothetical protein